MTLQAIVLGVGLAIVLASSVLLWERRSRRRRRTMRWWTAEVQSRIAAHTEACLYKAECEIEIAQLLAEMPADFTSPIFEAVRLGYAAERTALLEAEKRGLLGEMRLTVQGLDAASSVAFSDRRPTEEEPVATAAPVSGHAPRTEWREGKQVPAGSGPRHLKVLRKP